MKKNERLINVCNQLLIFQHGRVKSTDFRTENIIAIENWPKLACVAISRNTDAFR